MKADNTSTGHNRTIRLTEIPGLPSELTITVNYVQVANDGDAVKKAVCLDGVVIPEIVRALNNCHDLDGFFKGLKSENKPG